MWGHALPSADGNSTSDGVQPGFPRSNPDRFFYVGDEDLAVADASSLRCAPDRFDGFFNHIVTKHNLDLHLREKIDNVFGATIELGMPLLPAEALGFGD